MPKDNEVDEKVEDFFDRLYGMTFRLFLDPNSEEDEGNTVELRLGATVDNLALFETQDHAVLHTAATVAELRAEVERLRQAYYDTEQMWLAERGRADAAERRVGELENLLGAWYAEESRYGARLQAPGHHHQVPGIWDSDNGPIAGKPCAKCALWQQIRSITGADPT